MLYNLLFPLAEDYGFLNLFRYLTFRSGGALMTALLICFLTGGPLIRWLRSKQKDGQPIRDDGPESHLLTKKGTPTMGGAMVLLSLAVATLLWADLNNGYVWIALFITSTFGLIGFMDDWLKVTRRNSSGLKSRHKFLLQVVVAAIGAFLLSYLSPDPLKNQLALPLLKDVLLNLGWAFPAFAALVIVGSSNAVNLTDGLDGLAIVPIMIAAGSFAFIAYFVGNSVFSSYLQLSYVPGVGELTIFCAALVGASLGFLWFNAPPAMIFMGDTGSLSAGAALGTIAVATKHEIVLAIIGGLFVLETVSVIVQVASFKMTGKRVFRMAPLHHHYEKKGWAEPTIVIRFWIIAFILALIGLATLKLR